MSFDISFVRVERSSLVIGLSRDLATYLKSEDGVSRIEPSYYRYGDEGGEVWFNLASCMNGRCLSGKWMLCGAKSDSFEDIRLDFSKGSCRFEVTVDCKDGAVGIKVDYSPTKLGLRDRLTTVGLRIPYLFGRLFRGKKQRVLFASETRSYLSGNMEFIIKAANGDFGGKEVLYSFKSNESRLWFYIKTAFLAGRCSCVAVDDYFPLIYRLDFKGDRVFQLWHACGAFKAVGYSRLGKSGAPQPDDITHRNYTCVTVSSERIIPYYAEAFGIASERLIATGVPRTDCFFDKDYADKMREQFKSDLPQFEGKRIILFAPTFRGDGFNSAHYPSEMIDFEGLAQVCRSSNLAILFKMHPFVKCFKIPEEYEDCFADSTKSREINDLLFSADALITDYSSVIYEYSLLSRPIIFYTYDLEEYCKSRDFYMPIEQYTDGNIVRSSDELLELIRSEKYLSLTSEKIKKHSMSACDGNASKRVADLIFEKQKKGNLS